jgi:hypothetical protein
LSLNPPQTSMSTAPLRTHTMQAAAVLANGLMQNGVLVNLDLSGNPLGTQVLPTTVFAICHGNCIARAVCIRDGEEANSPVTQTSLLLSNKLFLVLLRSPSPTPAKVVPHQITPPSSPPQNIKIKGVAWLLKACNQSPVEFARSDIMMHAITPSSSQVSCSCIFGTPF